MLACCMAGLVSSPDARGAPIINVSLLARPSGTTSPFSSSITVSAGQVWDYEIVFTLGLKTNGVYNTNSVLPVPITSFKKSGPALLSGDGVASLIYELRQSATDQIQTDFSFTRPSNAAAYANYPTQLPRPDGSNGSVAYSTVNQITAGTVWGPAAPMAVSYNNGGSFGGTPVVRGSTGNFDLGGSNTTAALSGLIGATTGVPADNTFAANMVIGNGVFTVASLGSGATSTVGPSWAGLVGGATLVGSATLKYNGLSSQVQVNLLANQQSSNDPPIQATPLTLNPAAPTDATYHLTTSAGASTIMRGDRTPITATVANENNPGQDAIVVGNQSLTAGSNNNAIAPVSGSALPASGTQTVALNSSFSNAGLTLIGNSYGTAVVTASASITPSTNGATLHHNADTSATVNVGVMMPLVADALPGNTNAQLTTFGAALKSSVLANATPYGQPSLSPAVTTVSGGGAAKFGTKTNDALGTTAELLDGQAGGNCTLRMAWRTRTINETPGTVMNPPGPVYGLRSDVVQLTGLDGSTSDTPDPTAKVQSDKFVLQLSVSEAAFGGSHAALQTAIATGFLYLGWLDDTAATTSTHGGLPLWRNAVAGDFNNFTTNPDNLTGYIGSYAQYYADTQGIGHLSKVGGTSLIDGSRIGDWGVQDLDPAGTNGLGAVVWAVLDHNSIFAAVPEPSSIVMFGLGLLGLLACVARRRKKALAVN